MAGLLARGSLPCVAFPDRDPVAPDARLAAYSCGGSRSLTDANGLDPLRSQFIPFRGTIVWQRRELQMRVSMIRPSKPDIPARCDDFRTQRQAAAHAGGDPSSSCPALLKDTAQGRAPHNERPSHGEDMNRRNIGTFTYVVTDRKHVHPLRCAENAVACIFDAPEARLRAS